MMLQIFKVFKYYIKYYTIVVNGQVYPSNLMQSGQ